MLTKDLQIRRLCLSLTGVVPSRWTRFASAAVLLGSRGWHTGVCTLDMQCQATSPPAPHNDNRTLVQTTYSKNFSLFSLFSPQRIPGSRELQSFFLENKQQIVFSPSSRCFWPCFPADAGAFHLLPQTSRIPTQAETQSTEHHNEHIACELKIDALWCVSAQIMQKTYILSVREFFVCEQRSGTEQVLVEGLLQGGDGEARQRLLQVEHSPRDAHRLRLHAVLQHAPALPCPVLYLLPRLQNKTATQVSYKTTEVRESEAVIKSHFAM